MFHHHMRQKQAFSLLAVFALYGCGSENATVEPIKSGVAISQSHSAQINTIQANDAEPLDPMFAPFMGTWESPCLFAPDRLSGPGTGDFVRFQLSFTETYSQVAYQDYLDVDCQTQWRYGNGSSSAPFVFSTTITTESGLTAAVFSHDAGISLVEELSGDTTPGDDSSGSASISVVSSTRYVTNIIYRSDSDEVSLGDLNTARDDQSPPTRLLLDQPWTYIGDAKITY